MSVGLARTAGASLPPPPRAVSASVEETEAVAPTATSRSVIRTPSRVGTFRPGARRSSGRGATVGVRVGHAPAGQRPEDVDDPRDADDVGLERRARASRPWPR